MVGKAGFAAAVHRKCLTALECNPPSADFVDFRQSLMRCLQNPPDTPEDRVAETQSLVYWLLATKRGQT